MFAWARDGPPTKIPNGVGFKVGSEYPYIVIQIHYMHPLVTPDYASAEFSFTYEK